MVKTVLIADDHAIVRQGVRMIIERFPENYQCIEAATCDEVKKILTEQKIDHAVLDLFLTDGNLFPVIQWVLKNRRSVDILVYSMNAERIYAKRLLKKGVKGFISKHADFEELELAIGALLSGELYFSNELKEHLLVEEKSPQWENPINKLSDRELEVAEYAIAGLGTKEIARRMDVDIATASIHLRNAINKLDVKNVFELKEQFLLYKM